MSFTIVIAVIVIALFALAYVTRRRFGVVALALLAGSYLAETWAGQAVPYVDKSGINLSALGMPTLAIVTLAITLIPPVLLLVNSPRYHGKWQRLGAALGFALLAGILLTPTLAEVLPAGQFGSNIQDFVAQYRTLLVTAAIILAILDLFLASSKSHGHRGRKTS